jgi:hypothetical protein
VTTLPGFGGQLVAESFAATIADAAADRLSPQRIQDWSSLHSTIARTLGPASSVRTILETAAMPLLSALGFAHVDRVEANGQALVGTAHAADGTAVIVVVSWNERLDGYWRCGVTESMRRCASWCLLFNGHELRVVDASRLYSRRFASFDLRAALLHPRTQVVLQRIAGSLALSAEASSAGSLHSLVVESDRLSAAVRRSLRDGVLCASADIVNALAAAARRGRLNPSPERTFEQALTIVYRILFLLFAEARSLVPMWHPLYRESYSIDALCEQSQQSGRAAGLWDALRATARLAHAGCRAGDLLVPPFNGRLFSPRRTPLAERRRLDDEAARRAVLSLSTRAASGGAGRERIQYRDLGVEQLGAVYETLLDYRPTWAKGERRRDRPLICLQSGSGARKSTGTFYTPQALADFLVRRTLGPLVRNASPDGILKLRVLDPAMGSGAFLVAACRYMASAYERALTASGDAAPGDIDEEDRAVFRRLVAERCLYGVDINPMAVQLARLSLWLVTLAAGRPLSFLDHRLLAGDSLLGAWLANLRAPSSPSRRKRSSTLPLFDETVPANAMKSVLPLRFSMETPNDTIEQVRAKERTLASLESDTSGLSRWKRVANLWSAAWFAEDGTTASAFAATAADLASLADALPARTTQSYVQAADAIAREHRFFHWELEFPEVFFEADGRRRVRPGFDAVVVNPPWDMLRADSSEADARASVRRTLDATLRFLRDGTACSTAIGGHVNRYQLFLERTIDLTRSAGRFGLVLPFGLAGDHGSAGLRQRLFDRCNVDAMVGLDNRKGIFPIHRSVKFLLISATNGSSTERLPCRLGVDRTSDLESLNNESSDRSNFPVVLSRTTLERLSGPSLAIPDVRTRTDLAICEKAAALFHPLGDDRGWGARFGRELNATDDRSLFRASGHGFPIIDGRHIEPFRIDVERSERTIASRDAYRVLGADRVGRRRLAYRDVASATNRLTLIAAMMPANCASTHTVFCLRSRFPLKDQWALCGLLNSLVVNYLARLRVTTHVTTEIVERLPVPVRDVAPAAFREIGAIARHLSRRNDAELYARLNARVARMYQLSVEELEHVLETFPLIPREDRTRVRDAFLARP